MRSVDERIRLKHAGQSTPTISPSCAFSSVQFISGAQSCATLCDPMNHSTPGFPVQHQLLDLAQTHVHQAGNAIQSSYLLSSPSPPAFNLSQSFPMSQFFVSGYQSIGVSVSASVSPSSEYSGLISFRMDWLDLLAVQGTLKSLLQHHSSKASIHRHSAFFIVQLSHSYITRGQGMKWQKPID